MRVALALVWLLAGCSKLVDLKGLSGGKDDAGAQDGGPDTGMHMPHDAGDAGDGDTGAGDGDTGAGDAGMPCPEFGDMKMVRVFGVQHSFCIDSTEVTQAQYQQFLDDAPDLSTLWVSKACKNANITDVKPITFPPAPGTGSFPVGGVSYCDAEAFCSYAGKFVCGNLVDGGPLAPMDLNNPQRDMWARACAGEKHRVYPYGDTYQASYCNGESQHNNTTTEVSTLTMCVSLDGAIYDLSGNVWEWINSCNADSNLADYCYARGGAHNGGEPELTCAFSGFQAPRQQAQENLGIRCCAR
jgi:sulfatase modifying factor 1